MKTVKKPVGWAKPILAFSLPHPREASMYFDDEIEALWLTLCDITGAQYSATNIVFPEDGVPTMASVMGENEGLKRKAAELERLTRQVVVDGQRINELHDLVCKLNDRNTELLHAAYGGTFCDPLGQRSYKEKYEQLMKDVATVVRMQVEGQTDRTRDQLQAQSQELANLREQVAAQASVIESQRQVIREHSDKDNRRAQEIADLNIKAAGLRHRLQRVADALAL